MNIVRKGLMGIGGIALVTLVLALAVPKAAQGLVSTLVTIANTAANPVPTQAVDNPALAQTFMATGNCSILGNSTLCQAGAFLTIPDGMTAVVKDISGHCQVPTFLTSAPIDLNVSGGHYTDNGNVFTGFYTELSPTLVGHYGDLNFYNFARETTLYASSIPGSPGVLQMNARMEGGNCSVNIAGYYVKSGQ